MEGACTCMFSTSIQTFICTCMHTYVLAYIHTCIHAYIHTYIHTYRHTYIHTHIHVYAYMHTCVWKPWCTHSALLNTQHSFEKEHIGMKPSPGGAYLKGSSPRLHLTAPLWEVNAANRPLRPWGRWKTKPYGGEKSPFKDTQMLPPPALSSWIWSHVSEAFICTSL